MISVIMPVYKAEKHLDRSVTSVLNQTHTDFELLLIDDGSPDNSGTICDEWAKKDSRIKVFHNPGGGAADARNVGIANAYGDYIAFIDSDDFVTPDWLSSMYSVAKETEADLVKSGLVKFTETVNLSEKSEKYGIDVNITQTVRFENKQVSAHEFHRLLVDDFYYTAVWNQLVKTEIYKKCPFPVGRCMDDYPVFFSLLEYAENIQITDSACYYYGYHEDSVINTRSNALISDIVEAFREHCKILTLKYKDVKYAAATLHSAMIWFFYHLVGVDRISDVDYIRVNSVWKKLLEVCKLNNVKSIVPTAMYIQYRVCRISLPFYIKLVKLKKIISKRK